MHHFSFFENSTVRGGFEHSGVFILFTIAAIAYTYPLINYLGIEIPGEFDVYWFLWNLNRFSNSLGNTDIFYTNQIFYPQGTELYLATTPLLSAFSVPFQKIFGLISAYNILYLASYILSAYFMYLLAKYLTNDAKASIIAALIFAFCPYHAGHALRHLTLMSTQWIPLFFLAYLKLKTKQNFSNAIFLAFSSALIGWSEILYFGMCLITVGFDIFMDIKKSKTLPSKKFIYYFALAFGLFLLFCAPYVLGILQGLFSNQYTEDLSHLGNLVSSVYMAPDLFAFFTPPIFNPLFATITEPIYSFIHYTYYSNHIVEHSLFIGFTVLVLIFLVFKNIENEVVRWKNILIASFIMTLGPLPIIAGYIIPFALPYTVLALMPFSHLLRNPSRFDIIVMLAAGLLAAYSLKFLFKKITISWMQNSLFLLVCIAIMIEFYAPLKIFAPLSYSSFYDTIAKDVETYSILDIPYNIRIFDEYTAKLMYLQTIHKKPLIVGALARTPTQIMEKFENTRCIKHLFNLKIDDCKNLSELKDYGIRYVILHKKHWAYNETVIFAANFSLANLFGEAVYTDKDMVVYKVNY